MPHYTVFSKKLRDYLLDLGYTESKKPERNLKYPQYLVFFFDDTEKLRHDISTYRLEVIDK